ncbi:putative transcriptional corepressor SEUSS-like [Capsicum annuum]|nr:putative transcriptional corepressor SEUSS-like [Capsicum annuum]KAF3634120.1 putative transcriptional corepressor SEUSS-like [Capsicum annuum]
MRARLMLLSQLVVLMLTVGSTHVDRRLHQMFVGDRDYEGGYLKMEIEYPPNSKPDVRIESCVEIKGYSVVGVSCKDRPKLMFDIVCTLTDMHYERLELVSQLLAWEKEKNVFYIRDASGKPVEIKTIEILHEEIGQTMMLNVKKDPTSAKLLVLVLVILGIYGSQTTTCTLPEESMMQKYERCMIQYGRVYRTNTEKESRLKIFKENIERIEDFNDAAKQPYKLGINAFADLTNEEFRAA